MTDTANLPPTTPMGPQGDPDFALNLPYFEITEVGILQILMQMEKAAVERVHHTVKGFQEPATQLLDHTGRPAEDVAKKLHTKITAWLHELIQNPTLAEDWIAAPTTAAKQGRLTTDSWAIAYMLYQEFARLLQMKKLTQFINSMDFVLIMGLNALHHGRDPIEAYRSSFKIQAEDPETGQPIIGDHSRVLEEGVAQLQHVFHQFIIVKGLAEDHTMTKLVEGAEPKAYCELTMNGVRTLNHLMAVLGCTESMRQQGPALAQALMGELKVPESKTEAEVTADLERQLLNPEDSEA
jgi:ElaB/YqjD/DUF883 family membrane-anchored ribosome-binding protein